MEYFILSLLVLTSVSYCQTNSVTVDKPTIVINFTKNDSGEVVIKIHGHTQPLEIQFNGVKTGTLYEQDSAVNLSQLGFESAFLALDTASGASASKTDSQAVIPSVNPLINPNPPLSTPF